MNELMPDVPEIDEPIGTETSEEAELANALYEAAVRMQEDAQRLLDALKVKEPAATPKPAPAPEKPTMSMNAAKAASNALIGE